MVQVYACIAIETPYNTQWALDQCMYGGGGDVVVKEPG